MPSLIPIWTAILWLKFQVWPWTSKDELFNLVSKAKKLGKAVKEASPCCKSAYSYWSICDRQGWPVPDRSTVSCHDNMGVKLPLLIRKRSGGGERCLSLYCCKLSKLHKQHFTSSWTNVWQSETISPGDKTIMSVHNISFKVLQPFTNCLKRYKTLCWALWGNKSMFSGKLTLEVSNVKTKKKATKDKHTYKRDILVMND